MEKEYIVAGTLDELAQMMKCEFQLSAEEADFITRVLVLKEQRGNIADFRNGGELWQLNESSGENRTPIFNTRHSISFTDFGISFLKKVFICAGSFLMGENEIGYNFLMESLVSLYECYHYIKDVECCVYFKAIAWKKNHRGQFFCAKKLAENLTGECIYLDNNWSCPFQSGERCSITEEKIGEILALLCDCNVLIPQGEAFDFKK